MLFAPANSVLSPYGGRPIFTSPTEALATTVHLVMTGGLVTAFPVATVIVYRLVRPLLSRRLRRFTLLFLPAVFVCFLCGAAFAYFVLLRVGIRFLLGFGGNFAVPLISITEYMSLVTAMLFWVGVVFELPLVMFLLTKLTPDWYKRFQRSHRYVPTAAFVLSAIITPTFDVVNSTMVAVPIILLFEVGLFLSWMARPKEAGHRTIIQRIEAMLRRAWAWCTSWWEERWLRLSS